MEDLLEHYKQLEYRLSTMVRDGENFEHYDSINEELQCIEQQFSAIQASEEYYKYESE